VVASKENFPLLAALLAEQQRLDTPVARFSTAHDQLAPGVTALAPQLIPLTKPQPGEQYAFEVDLDSCTGCKACVAACHSLNGLDDTETWRDVGLIVSPEPRHPFTQTVTTACHHCADPACLNGCPVLAYEKDPATGIVRHLDDQCIGCSYCVLKCPYDVPKFNARLGIVRKCDMCHGRLAHGEAPACVQACPTHAIRIVTVGALKTNPATNTFLNAAPDPNYTQPTTRYITQRPVVRTLVAADASALRPQPPHWPLIFLLTLMPMAVGCGIADKALSLSTAALGVAGWCAGAAGLAFSVLHLGQPRRAWRVFLGWRQSWLSREALVFGAWFPLATSYLALRIGWLKFEFAALRPVLAIATATLGALGLLCSVMVYVDTRRAFWRFANTAPRFLGTALVLGLGGALTTPDAPRALGFALALATIAKLAFEARALLPVHGDRNEITPELLTASLLAGPLRAVNELRLFAAAFGGVLLPLTLALGAAPAWLAWPALALSLGGELAERYLFFRAVDAPKMPGVGA
jgi:Fe-S-cluster-containing dehydrogenase component/DMSO reductase anchor subunit